MAMVKNLYKGTFVYPHIGYTIRRAAYSAKQAKLLMARVIAKKQGVFISDVMKWLKDNKNNYVIELEAEFEEEED